jgi:hypothetical protein
VKSADGEDATFLGVTHRRELYICISVLALFLGFCEGPCSSLEGSFGISDFLLRTVFFSATAGRDDVTDVAAGHPDPPDAVSRDCREAACSWHSIFLKRLGFNLFVTGLSSKSLKICAYNFSSHGQPARASCEPRRATLLFNSSSSSKSSIARNFTGKGKVRQWN